MPVADRIHQYVQRLPERLQVEVLDFVEFLLAKTEHSATEREEQDWNQLSLALAMRGMENEDGVDYSISDLKEPFS